MNKDVMYIEPEEDITDILTNIKGAKHKIIALVPPKKTGVLRSAVNFKLISKAARQSGKTIVLITSDESLLKLANSVKMPTAKTLQSKPKLPTEELDADEFGDEIDDDKAEKPAKDDEAKKDDVIDEAEEPKAAVKPKTTGKKDDAKAAGAAAAGAAAAKKAESIEIDLDDDDDKKPTKGKKKNLNIPDFKKFRTPIILAVIIILLVSGFLFWANVIAPAAKISVKIRTSKQNFDELVHFTTDEKKAQPEDGIFLLEEKSIKKSVSSDFEATGEINKGEKAKGTVTVTRPAGTPLSCADKDESTFTIPAGTTFTINGKSYITTTGSSANATDDDVLESGPYYHHTCSLKRDISSGAIPVVAKEPGADYNIDGSSSGWSSSLVTRKKYSVSSSAMTGGTDKIVKVVTEKDVEDASDSLVLSGESEARTELYEQYNQAYVVIKDSLKADGGKVTPSPAVDQEVVEDVTPKVIKEVTYKIYVVDRVALDKYISKVTREDIGDNTQIIYSTGVALKDGDEDKAHIDNYHEDGLTGKLKSVVKTGPEVNEQMVADKTLGRKVGEVQTMLKSINGISEVKVETSYFFVTRVPNDINKVKIEINLEQ